ncbi:AsmA family protein [Plastoroseomonas arctica]|uniref:AsmA family protein n=1 Tax=Plastoroseomonas arctica TaxID=1509237 RepID=A0AAF1K4V8_9PROT|nr:AsmA-like C-terminal region-containing protein [Plastoroseomonas arctica]MBR0655700.1 AsmA family protein [Plastoroseomonas arctica]
MTRRRAAFLVGILAILALWLAPRAINWEGQRERIAALATRELGRPVAISGPLRLTLLPQPMIEASDVVVGGAPDDIGVAARALRVTLALPALLIGRLDPREVVLVGAEIRLPWPPGNAPALRPPPWLTTFDARIEESRVLMGEVALEDVAARVTSGGSLDAVRATGAFAWRGQAMNFAAAIGRPGYDGIATFELSVAADGARAQVRGVLVEDGGFDGRIEASGPDLSLVLPAPPIAFRAAGKLQVSAELLAADDIAIDLAGVPARGALALRLVPSPRLDIALSSARLDLDAWAAALRAAPPPVLPTALDLAAEVASFRGVPLRRLRGGVFREGERVTLSDVAAILPGEMAVDIAGASAGQRLELSLRFAGPDLRTALTALGLPLPGTRPDRQRAVEGRARLVLEEAQFAMPEMNALVDGARLTGGGVWRYGARPSVGIGIAVDRLDLDTLLPDAADWQVAGQRLGGIDGNLRIAAEVVALRGQALERVTLDAGFEAGRIAVRRLSARAAGADLAVSGSVALGAVPRFADLSIEATASTAGGLLALLPATWQPGAAFAEQPLALRFNGAGPADALALRIEGDLAELRVEAQVTLDLAQARGQGALTLRHPGAPRLLASLWPGQELGWIGEGSLSVIAGFLVGPAGASSENFELVAGQIRTRGTLTLGLDGPRPVLAGRIAAERLMLPEPPWRGREPLSLDLLGRFDAEIALTAQRLEVPDLPVMEDLRVGLRLAGGEFRASGIEARMAGGALAGEWSLTLAPAEAPRLRASLRLTDAALTGALLGLPIDVTSGTISEAALALEAIGHSPDALAAGLAGRVRIGIRDGALRGIDLAALQAAFDLPEPEAALRQSLLSGNTGFDRLDVVAELAGGIAHIEQAAIAAGNAGLATAAGQVDVARGTLDVAITARPGAAEAPEVALRVQGLVADPRRTLELSDWLRWRAAR